MGHDELLADLQKKGDEQVREIWQNAEDEVNERKAHASQKLEEKNSSLKQKETSACDEERMAVLISASKNTNQILMNAEQQLAKRLYALAQKSIKMLRDQKYASVFTALAGELPDCLWDEVIVHPDDRKQAETVFKKAGIITDKNISGGFKVIGNHKTFFINNTFEKRLERAWPVLLPQLIKQVKETLENDETIA
jgi:V/A-type H+-transporting ATPase subunit E